MTTQSHFKKKDAATGVFLAVFFLFFLASCDDDVLKIEGSVGTGSGINNTSISFCPGITQVQFNTSGLSNGTITYSPTNQTACGYLFNVWNNGTGNLSLYLRLNESFSQFSINCSNNTIATAVNLSDTFSLVITNMTGSSSQQLKCWQQRNANMSKAYSFTIIPGWDYDDN